MYSNCISSINLYHIYCLCENVSIYNTNYLCASIKKNSVAEIATTCIAVYISSIVMQTGIHTIDVFDMKSLQVRRLMMRMISHIEEMYFDLCKL